MLITLKSAIFAAPIAFGFGALLAVVFPHIQLSRHGEITLGLVSGLALGLTAGILVDVRALGVPESAIVHGVVGPFMIIGTLVGAAITVSSISDRRYREKLERKRTRISR